DLLHACPHHGFTELHQLYTFYNALNPTDQDSLNSTAGGNLLERSTQDVLTIIENKSKVHNSRNKSIVSQVKSSDVNSSSPSEIAKLTHAVNQQTSVVTTAMTAILKQFQATPPPASVKAVEEVCVTCDVVPLSELEKIKKVNDVNIKAMQAQINNVKNELRNEIQTSIQASMSNQTNKLKNMMASFFQMNTASTSGSGSLPSNTVANPRGELKAITTRSGLVLDGPSVPMPPPFINLEEDERVEETLMDPELAEYTIKVLHPLVQKAKPHSLKNYMVHQRDPRHLHIPYTSRMNQENGKRKMNSKFTNFGKCSNNFTSISLLPMLILIQKYQKMLKSLLSNKEKFLEQANTPLNENFSAVILKKLPEKLGDPGKFLIPCCFSKLKCKALADLGASINLMPLSLTFPPDFVIVDYKSDPRVPLILGRHFLWTARAFIDVHGEEMILRDGDERLILNMRHDTSSYSNNPQRESINMIDIYNVSYEVYLEDLFENEKITNHPSGNPTLSLTSHTNLTSSKVKYDIFDPEGEIVIEKLLNLDSTQDLPPSHDNPLCGSTTSSSPSLTTSEISDYSLEEFADELAHFAFPPGIDYLPFDIKSDLREIEYLLNHDPIEEIDSILEDSVNKNSPDDNLVDTISEMFTDKHALDYSSPPLWDDYDDELSDLETVNDNTYDDPFDSKEDKIKESKLLIDELDPPRSSDFLPSPKCGSVFYEDFSEVDVLPSTDNEDKVFNPGILIHENHFEVTNYLTPEKNVKKIAISNASLILEDFNPPLYELPFQKEVPGSETLLSFSSENEEKFSTLGFSLLKQFILLISRNYLIRALKLSKSLKFLKARCRFFLALMKRTFVFWMFCIFISIPLDQFKIAPIFEASRACGFCPSFTRASHPQLHFGNPISKSYRLTFIFEHT
ncbi:hypothetical protein Tco_0741721, partial [Tanacetum coccineum]